MYKSLVSGRRACWNWRNREKPRWPRGMEEWFQARIYEDWAEGTQIGAETGLHDGKADGLLMILLAWGVTVPAYIPGSSADLMRVWWPQSADPRFHCRLCLCAAAP